MPPRKRFFSASDDLTFERLSPPVAENFRRLQTHLRALEPAYRSGDETALLAGLNYIQMQFFGHDDFPPWFIAGLRGAVYERLKTTKTGLTKNKLQRLRAEALDFQRFNHVRNLTRPPTHLTGTPGLSKRKAYDVVAAAEGISPEAIRRSCEKILALKGKVTPAAARVLIGEAIERDRNRGV